jgi:hypothetical protein
MREEGEDIARIGYVKIGSNDANVLIDTGWQHRVGDHARPAESDAVTRDVEQDIPSSYGCGPETVSLRIADESKPGEVESPVEHVLTAN